MPPLDALDDHIWIEYDDGMWIVTAQTRVGDWFLVRGRMTAPPGLIAVYHAS